LSNLDRSGRTTGLSATERILYFAGKNWMLLFAVLFGGFVILPFFAPLFMFAGWESLGKAVYTLYSFLCHQLPQRSYFLFGPKISYSIPEIQAAWRDTLDLMLLRQFTGSAELGWKVAWSDRMVSMYGSIWLFGLAWWPVRKRLKALRLWGLLLFLLPMAVDGTSHLVSDLYGLGQGFRDSNLWLVTLTGNTLPANFYAGDAWGSFNAWMRLVTGVLFGTGIVWFGFPFFERAFEETRQTIQAKMERQAAWQARENERYEMLMRIARRKG